MGNSEQYQIKEIYKEHRSNPDLFITSEQLARAIAEAADDKMAVNSVLL